MAGNSKILTLREQIADTIREDIVKGRFLPGEKLSETDLADKYGASRTPVREALRLLEYEGLLTLIPRKGAEVASIDVKKVRDVYEIRALLESYAAKCAAEKMTDSDLKKLVKLNDKMRASLQANDVQGFAKADNQFHAVFIQACGNEKLIAIVHSLLLQFQNFKSIFFSIPDKMENSIKGHDYVIEAFKKRDSELASRLVKQGVEKSAEFLAKEVERRVKNSK